jgi:hypothetical protein
MAAVAARRISPGMATQRLAGLIRGLTEEVESCCRLCEEFHKVKKLAE